MTFVTQNFCIVIWIECPMENESVWVQDGTNPSPEHLLNKISIPYMVPRVQSELTHCDLGMPYSIVEFGNFYLR